MPQTAIRGQQVLNGTIQRADLDTSTVGQAVVAKIVQGTNVTLSSSGTDSGTGDVTISVPSAVSANANNKAVLGSDSLILVPGVAAGASATTHGQTVSGDDPQLTNARTPTAHASTHVTGGSDLILPVTYTNSGLAPAFNQRLQIRDRFDYPLATALTTSAGLLSISPIPWYLTAGGTQAGCASVWSGTGQDAFNKCWGVWYLQTGTTATGFATMAWYGNLIIPGLGPCDLYYRVAFGRLPTSADNSVTYIGLTDSGTSTANSIYLIITYNATYGACWQGFCSKASTSSNTGTPVTTPALVAFSASALTYYNIRISLNAAWTSATFYVNGVQIGAPVTSNIPATIQSGWFYCGKTVGAAAQAVIYIDDFMIDYQYAMP